MEQIFIAIFGLSALWMALGTSPIQRKWAPILGLCGQPFWFYFAYQSSGWGILILVCCYTAVYLRGAAVQWGLLK